jgi:hypothetical protein
MSSRRIDPMSLPEARLWSEGFGGGLGVVDFVSSKLTVATALAFATVLWPRFVEVRGCVLWSEHYQPDNFQEWWDKLGGNRQAIESTINHLHLWDVFDTGEDPSAEEALEELAGIVAQAWRAALKDEFPGKRFEVTVARPDDDYGPTITFSSRE